MFCVSGRLSLALYRVVFINFLETKKLWNCILPSSLRFDHFICIQGLIKTKGNQLVTYLLGCICLYCPLRVVSLRVYVCTPTLFLFTNHRTVFWLSALWQTFGIRPFPKIKSTFKGIHYQVWWVKWMIGALSSWVRTMGYISGGARK